MQWYVVKVFHKYMHRNVKFISTWEISKCSISLCFDFFQEWFCLLRSQLDFICILRTSIFRNLIFLPVGQLEIFSKGIIFLDLLPSTTIAFFYLLYENFLFLLFILTQWQNNVFLVIFFLPFPTDLTQLTDNKNNKTLYTWLLGFNVTSKRNVVEFHCCFNDALHTWSESLLFLLKVPSPPTGYLS